MRQSASVLLFLLFSSVALAQQPPVQLTTVPPKPTCALIFQTGSCADLWRNYKQALAQRQREEIQIYVNRQKELASQAATAPLQQQIDNLNKLSADQQEQIVKMQKQIQDDAAAGLQAQQADAALVLKEKSDSHRQGMWQGLGLGVGGTLFLIVVVFIGRKFFSGFAITRKSETA